MLVVDKWFVLPAKGFVVGGIIAGQSGDVYKQAVFANRMDRVFDFGTQNSVVGNHHIESMFRIKIAFANLAIFCDRFCSCVDKVM